MGLEYAVITSVNRDDQPDGGAGIFALTIQQVRRLNPGCRVEVLVPDFRGSDESVEIVMAAEPDVLNHNVETVPRLYAKVRAGARYERSLGLLRRARELRPRIPTKSGLMVGLGETREELFAVLRDLRAAGCDLVTIGQYLRPTRNHLPVQCYYAPQEFAELRRAGLALGLRHVEAGPLVRSSYHAREQSEAAVRYLY
jgi:lipoic acid synthetase